MCFRPEVVEPNWAYAGAGKGGYEKVETYNYVGEGAGSYNKDFFSNHVVYGWRMRGCCLCLLCSAGMLVLFGFLAPFLETLWDDVLSDLLPNATALNNSVGNLPADFSTPLLDGIGNLPGASDDDLPCSDAGENCSSTKCCVNKTMSCFEKNLKWAGCRTSCSPGINFHDPVQHRTRWNCLFVDKNPDKNPASQDGLQGLPGLKGSPDTPSPPVSTTSPPPTPSTLPPFEAWPNVIAEGDACRPDETTGACAAGTTCTSSAIGPNATCVRGAPPLLDQMPATEDATASTPVSTPDLTGIAPDKVTTKTTEAVAVGDTTLMLEQSTGIVVGSTITITSAGFSESGTIAALEDGVLTVEPPWATPFPAGSDILIVKDTPTDVVESGLEPGFTKTNHFTTLRGEVPAGVTELPVASHRGFAVGDNILIENPGDNAEQKEIIAVSKKTGDFKLIIGSPTQRPYFLDAILTQVGPIGEARFTLQELPDEEPDFSAMAFEDQPAEERAAMAFEDQPTEDTAAWVVPAAPTTRAGKGRPRAEPTMDIPEEFQEFPEPPKDGKKFDCAQGFESWEAGWADDKRYYCCKYYGRGCPPETTTPPKHDCAADFKDWENKWNTDKQYYCCKYYGRGCPDVPSMCDMNCELKGVPLTCSERVQYSATHQFRGQDEACSQGHKQVLGECPICGECPLEETGCEKKKGEFPYDCDLNFEMWQESWSPGEKRWCCESVGKGCEDPPDGHLPGCATSCVHDDGTSKTCGEWIQSVAAEGLQGQAGLCQDALGKVLQDCPVCSVCGLEESGCVDAPPDGGQALTPAAPTLFSPALAAPMLEADAALEQQPPEGDQADAAPAQQPLEGDQADAAPEQQPPEGDQGATS